MLLRARRLGQTMAGWPGLRPLGFASAARGLASFHAVVSDHKQHGMEAGEQGNRSALASSTGGGPSGERHYQKKSYIN